MFDYQGAVGVAREDDEGGLIARLVRDRRRFLWRGRGRVRRGRGGGRRLHMDVDVGQVVHEESCEGDVVVQLGAGSPARAAF